MTRHLVDLDRLHRLVTSELADQSESPVDEGSLLGRDLWCGTLGVHLRAETLESLRARYRALSPEHPHLGLDPRGAAEAELLERRRGEGQVLLGNPYPPELQLFAQGGVPPSLRQQLWTFCLGADRGSLTELQALTRDVGESEWLTDDVLRLDVVEHCISDVCYFPFDELAECLILALSRDAAVTDDCEAGPPQVPVRAGPAPAPDAEDESAEASTAQFVPPCGVVPFRGFSRYAYPFAFLADRLEIAYPLFRAFYCRHLSRLHTISSEPATLLPLCALFEGLVAAACGGTLEDRVPLDRAGLRWLHPHRPGLVALGPHRRLRLRPAHRRLGRGDHHLPVAGHPVGENRSGRGAALRGPRLDAGDAAVARLLVLVRAGGVPCRGGWEKFEAVSSQAADGWPAGRRPAAGRRRPRGLGSRRGATGSARRPGHADELGAAGRCRGAAGPAMAAGAELVGLGPAGRGAGLAVRRGQRASRVPGLSAQLLEQTGSLSARCCQARRRHDLW